MKKNGPAVRYSNGNIIHLEFGIQIPTVYILTNNGGGKSVEKTICLYNVIVVPVEVDSVGHVVDVFQDFVEAELVLDDGLLSRLHQCNANDLKQKQV